MDIENQLFLYVIKLKNDKYFLHSSIEKKKELILIESQILYDFVKNNEPICITEMIQIKDMLEINNHVKQYMLFYGIENVRGGSYTNEILSKELLNVLQIEFELTEKNIIENSKKFDSLMLKYKNIKNVDINFENNKRKKDYDDYISAKRKLVLFNPIDINGKTFHFNRSMLHSSNWLIDYLIDCNFKNEISEETIEIYKETIRLFKIITPLYFTIKEDINFRPIEFLKNPEIIYDIFFYDRKEFKYLEKMFEMAIYLTNIFEHMMYVIINHVDELEFDVKIYNLSNE